MGNEQSNSKVPKNLSSGVLQQLKSTFPTQPTTSLWKTWSIWTENSRNRIETDLKDSEGRISWEKYQAFVDNTLFGSCEDRVRFVLRLGGNKSEDQVSVEALTSGLAEVFHAYECLHGKPVPDADADVSVGVNARKLAESVLHDLVFVGVKRKQMPKRDSDKAQKQVDFDDAEKAFYSQPLVELILCHVLSASIQITDKIGGLGSSSLKLPVGVPAKLASTSFFSPLHTVFLQDALPHDLREHRNWRPIFNTAVDGESFAKLVGGIKNCGPSILVVKDKEDNIFGGFAPESWRAGPKFFGKSSAFLFHLHPVMNIYETTPFNENFQYFNLKQKTLPNGLGMGGKLDYFGLWIDAEFGLVRTAPSCTTFHSPQLGVLEGKIKDLEIWGVGPEPGADEEGGRSVLDMDPEAQMVMEMMGKTFHSKMLRDPEQENDEES